MRSKATIKGHPIHPILVAFPIAFFIGTLLFDLLAVINTQPSLWQTGQYLEIAGIVAAVITAIPGIIDFIGAVPPKSSAKKRAAKHGLLNVTTLILFIIALILRQNADISPWTVIGVEALGAVTLFIAGWMGGTLVYRNQIGVDIRYAHAGKWKEERLPAGNGRVAVADIGELKENQMKLVHVQRRRIVIGRTDKGYVAFDDHCTHRGGSLAGGALMCGTVQCPWHGSQFDVYNGAATAGPAKQSIHIYNITTENGKVWIQLP